MINLNVSKIAAVVMLGGLTFSVTACATGHVVDNTPVASQQYASSSRVEARIKALHDKLKVTAAQEDQWEAVADVIRSNEGDIHELVEARHANEHATAVEDLKSYKEIADAHAAGLARLIPAFEGLYNAMPPAQQANADEVFSKYEGHEGRHHMAHKSRKKAAAAPAAKAAQ